MKKIIVTLLLWLFCILGMQAQSNTGTLGGEATGSGGTASFTAGEVFYTYKSGSTASVTEGVQQSYRVLPTGVISGDATICAGTAIQLSIALTGEGPWFGTLSDGTGFSGSDNPLLVTVTPSETTTYTIATLSSETATAIASGLSGSAVVEVKQLAIWYADTDMDTFGDMAITQSSCIQPLGYVSNSLDCNDNAYSLTNSCNSVVNLKLFIEGYYAGAGTMATVLNNQSGDGAMTDVEMVTVELFDATLAPITSTTAMLHTDGTCQAVFTNSPTGAYYVAVRGSNSIRTWTAFKQTVGNTPLTYDFSTEAAQAAGGNMKDLGSGVYGFYSGDLDLPVGDGFIDLPDYSIWEADYNLGNIGVYPTDLDGDAFVDLPDYSIWEANYNAGIIEIQP
jgi:hypothetical protein